MKLLLAALALAALAQPAAAKFVEVVVDLAVTVNNPYGREFTRPIKLTIFRDDARERAPFMLLNHGRPAKAEDFVKMGRVRFADNARYFVGLGFVVLLPTRMGYGESSGEDMEYSGSCARKSYPPVYETSARQSIAVLEYARSLPYVDATRGVAVGQSFGGATAITLASKNVPGMVAAVNFAGGGGGDPIGRPGRPCSPDLLEQLFAGYGASARIPTLWIYSENDLYFGKEFPQAWFKAYRAAGGSGEFLQLPPLPADLGSDGHVSFTRYPSAWRPAFESFLQRNGF